MCSTFLQISKELRSSRTLGSEILLTDFLENLYKSVLTFKHQIVYNPTTR